MYTGIEEDTEGLRKLFRQFSFPGGIPSHVAAQTPGSIHEGGELGYALVHAYGAAFDNPDLVVACVVGDGEAETGPLAASWHSNKFLNPVTRRRGAARSCTSTATRSPTRRCWPASRMTSWSRCCAATATGRSPSPATTRPTCISSWPPLSTTRSTRSRRSSAMPAAAVQTERPVWPMIVLRTPKGWTGPKAVDGKQVEGTWRAHQVPLAETHDNPAHRAQLEEWMRSYAPEELFDDDGRLRAGAARAGARRRPPDERQPARQRRAAAARPGPARLSRLRRRRRAARRPQTHEATRVLGTFLRDVIARNRDRFRLMGPDETASNRLDAVFESTDKVWLARDRCPSTSTWRPTAG